MDLKGLMSGIAVVIDDALDQDTAFSDNGGPSGDQIVEIVALFEQKWSTPFYKANHMPPDDMWPNLLEFASFVLLDWKLWPNGAGASELEKHGIEKHLSFLRQAHAFSVPVFIFTNENLDDIKDRVNAGYRSGEWQKSFVFVQSKGELLSNGSLNLDRVYEWAEQHASVYALKKWDQLFRAARRSLFSSMYAVSPDWPRVFWRSYLEDDVDPGLALTEMINDSLRGRMQTSAFDEGLPSYSDTNTLQVPKDQLRALIAATCFVDNVTDGEVRCGDVFKYKKREVPT